MQSDEIRKAFLDFFQEREHRVISSSPLVLPWDPTVLFTTAGMQQFKPYFQGQKKPPSRRLTSVQKCFRTSDIDQVGDESHLTFFEMLGNFSIGDYFKPEAIAYAWEFVTRVLDLATERLWITVFLDDDEAFKLWRRQGVPEERMRHYGEEDNYWFAGEVGPCGPCSEIYYDFGSQFGCGPDCEPSHSHCGRFLEIWNLVFMTFFQDSDGSRSPLPQKNIDTGAGLERLAAAMIHNQGKWKGERPPSAYDTDLLRPIIERIEVLSGKSYGRDEATDRAMRVVAEHNRAATFLIGDERVPTVPSNEERGYAVRRVIRRSIYYGRHDLGLGEPFLNDVAKAVVEKMATAYPELEAQRHLILEIITSEEQQFEQTLNRGLVVLEGAFDEILSSEATVLPGEKVFLLHDTFGFPVEVTREIVRQRGLTIDEAGFQEEMDKQRQKSRAAAKEGKVASMAGIYATLNDIKSRFVGYNKLGVETVVLAIVTAGNQAKVAKTGEEVEVVLAQTSFYPEGGGQVGDRGEIIAPNGLLVVEDTQRATASIIVHRCSVARGKVAIGDAVMAEVDSRHRHDTMCNHTATHLLHAALRQVLGDHVRQSGSLVAPNRLRFDFTHPEALTAEQIVEIEQLVNDKIRINLPVATRNSTFDEAISDGVLAFFGDTYGEEVRVVEISGGGAQQSSSNRFSSELCGGTHCQSTSDVGFFLVVGESSIGAGMRRLEAVSGNGASAYVREQLAVINEISHNLSASRETLLPKLAALLVDQDAQRKKIERLERLLAAGGSTNSHGEASREIIDGLTIRAEQVEATSEQALRYIGDRIKGELKEGGVILGAVIDGQVALLAIAGPGAIKRGLTADGLIREVSCLVGGSGGGRPDMARGGGKDPSRLKEALEQVPAIARRLLQG